MLGFEVLLHDIATHRVADQDRRRRQIRRDRCHILEIALYAVEPNGDLYWYKYLGHGEQDPTGSTGWHPNSGTQIGLGW